MNQTPIKRPVYLQPMAHGSRFGGPKTPVIDLTVTQFYELRRDQHLSWDEIAQRIGVTVSTLRCWARRRGVKITGDVSRTTVRQQIRERGLHNESTTEGDDE